MGFETLWRMAERGGILVGTPEHAPVLATVMQLDGTILVFVAQDLLDADQNDARAALVAQHQARVQATLAPLALLVDGLRQLDRLLRGLTRYGSMAALPLLSLPIASGVRHEAGWRIAAWALPGFALPLLGPVVRRGLRAVIRRQLRRALGGST